MCVCVCVCVCVRVCVPTAFPAQLSIFAFQSPSRSLKPTVNATRSSSSADTTTGTAVVVEVVVEVLVVVIDDDFWSSHPDVEPFRAAIRAVRRTVVVVNRFTSLLRPGKETCAEL